MSTSRRNSNPAHQVVFDCINLFQWLLTGTPEGPADPGTPDSPRGPCAPSGPLAPVGPASPYEEKKHMIHDAWAQLLLLKINNIFKCHFQSLGCTFICISVVIKSGHKPEIITKFTVCFLA